ncbi:hypothetical protein [Candidatus Frankia alpina]|uniref:hypothetical protein n=1 Tax=Candidatus Frankia alpina TaxID=2699483 RepID=UPI0013D82C3A|nr:hypothetical protein [Candidatus Frankia alpina]
MPSSDPKRRETTILPERGDLIAGLAGRLEALDALLNRLEDAERQAADASEHLIRTQRWQEDTVRTIEHLIRTQRWQEDTVRTIQEERARMRQRQHALDELADHARAAVAALANHRSVPREVHELAVELQVLDAAGFLTRRGRTR